MSKSPLISMSVLLALAAAVSAGAQTAPAPAPLTLEDCVRIALQNQVDVVVARNNVTAARSRWDIARSEYFPQVTLANNAFVWGDGGALERTTTGTALTANSVIWDGGLREANVRGARYGIRGSEARLTRTKQTVAFVVTQLYYDVLRATNLADVAQADVDYNTGLREQVQARVDLGAAASVDVLPVDAQLANAQVTLLSAQNAVRTASLELQNAMGLSPRPDFAIVDTTEAPRVEAEPLPQYVSTALEHRPDITEAAAVVGAAQADVGAAKLQMYPRPVISARYDQGLSGGFDNDGGQVVGGVVFDIFSGGARRAAYREAQANERSAQQQREQVVKDIQMEVEEAYLNLTNAQQRLQASETSLAAAQKNYEVQGEVYKQGLGITLDILNAEVQLIIARTNAVQARYDYYTAIAQLEYAIGKDSPEAG